ncbi:MAG: ABC transporter permease [Halofilum sp. (in: g-proteobacteria)]|nr:ABC transporter permease [Halofilum sp. (in: g-proteobacteria)]
MSVGLAQARFAAPALATPGVLVAVVAWSIAGAGTDGNVLVALYQWFADPQNWQGGDGIPARSLEQIHYTLVSMAIALVIALPLGIGLGHWGRGGLLAINVSNIGRAVPEFGVVILVFLIAGYGDLPIIVALVALAIPPMVTNSYVGMRAVDPDIRQAARGVGMTGWQVLWQVELPIALPVVMAGVRTSAVQVMSTATLAAYVGLGGLGRYLIDGLAQRQMTQVIGGAIVVALLALAIEAILARVQRLIVSEGLRG